MSPTARQALGSRGELVVAKNVTCPGCKTASRTLRVLPANFKCADVVCDFCGYLAQVKTKTARGSQVDVVQSVGRVMRRAPGKELGYIVLPIVVPSGQAPEEALRDNQKYKVVWQVLQALRSHDDRFHAMINQIELNKTQDIRAIILRMKRAHGHLASVIRMMEEGSDCESVLTQLAAVNKAIARSGFAIVATGLQDCMADGTPAEEDLKKMEKLFLSLA